MSNIITYPAGTPSASDLVLGTELADPNVEGDTNKTRNFTIQQIANLATNTGTLGYTVYSGIISQAGNSAAPTVTVLQNTIPGTMTWARTNAGIYTVTNSGTPFTDAKTIVFINGGNVASSVVQWEWTSTSVVTIKTNGADTKMTKGAIEIRVYS
jgi:hypothetical protein